MFNVSKKSKIIFCVISMFCFVFVGIFVFQSQTQKKSIKTVVHPLSFVKEEYIRCISHNDDEAVRSCLQTLTAYAYDSYSMQEITKALDTLSFEEKGNWCHQSMHYLGWRAYQKEGSIAKAFMHASELCNSGMYHGITEEFLREHGLDENVGELIKNVCVEALSERPDLSEGTKSLCYHGLGHGLMYITSVNMSASLNYCDLLGEREARSCYGGVFMENIINENSGQKKEDLKNMSHCTGLTPSQKTACYFNQGLSYLDFTDGNVEESMKLCTQIEGENRRECFLGVGANFPSPGRSHEDSGIACLAVYKISPEAYRACVEGGLRAVSQLDSGKPEGLIRFCTVARQDDKPFCFYEMGLNLKEWLTPSETIEHDKCGAIEDVQYRKACEEGGSGVYKTY